jgi:hypothetical protein
MFWHTLGLRHVRYGKVEPAPWSAVDPRMRPVYEWLGQQVGFSPQIWLSRSQRCLSAFRERKDDVCFGFNIMPGAVPLDYGVWCDILHPLMRAHGLKPGSGPPSDASQSADGLIEDSFDDLVSFLKEEGWFPCQREPHWNHWDAHHDLQALLERYLFVLNDQVVVPRLNLKSAKEIWVRNDRQKKKLRRMGFIEDRIKVRRIQSGR